MHRVVRTVQPEITQRESLKGGSSETGLVEGAQEFALRVPFGAPPPPLDKNLCFRSLPGDQHEDAAARAQARMQFGEGAGELLLGKILESQPLLGTRVFGMILAITMFVALPS